MSKYGRCPGGVIVYIKDKLLKGIQRISEEFKYGIVLKLDKLFFGFSSDVILFCVYIPPEGSACYESNEDGMNVLESLLDWHRVHYDDAQFCILGDVNARTGGHDDFIIDDRASYLPMEEWYVPDTFDQKRVSQDKVINMYGKKLLDICRLFSVHVCNGRKNDPYGDFTYISHRGSSVIDYCIVSSDLYERVSHFSVYNDDFGSDHMPCLVKMNVMTKLCVQSQTETLKPRIRYKWKPELSSRFLNQLLINVNCNKESIKQNMEAGNVEQITSIVSTVVTQAAQCMLCNQNEMKRKNEWWDSECEMAKHYKMKILLRYRTDRCDLNLKLYIQERNKFKNLCRTKKGLFERHLQLRISESLSDVNRCWKTLKSLSKGNETSCNISSQKWCTYFRNLLNINIDVDKRHHDYILLELEKHSYYCNACNENTPEVLNNSFTGNEITNVIHSLKNNKAPGIDGLVIEMIKTGSDILLPFLVELFNLVLRKGHFPSKWSQALLMPLHKKGSKNDVNNYRGIALLNVIGKIFTKCLTLRLTKYYVQEKLFFEEQAGFREGRSTIDQIFVLQTCVNKYLSKPNGRMYCAFIDFTKAFDSVSHDFLFYKLIIDGVHGNFLHVIKSMYSKLESCVLVENGKYCSESFECKVGTRQGCMLSPTLFIIYLNIFLSECKDAKCMGIYIDEQFNNLMSLLYADDALELGDTVIRLQRLLNQLDSFCSKWGLNVNLEKSKIIVFRNGGKVRDNEKWFYRGAMLEVVSYYKYVGLITTSSLNWTLAQKTLATQAMKSLFLIKKANRVSGGLMPKVLISLFDKLVLPILLYGAEIWGCTTHKSIETVHIKFLKYVLGLPLSAPNASVLGECGRYPIRIQAILSSVKYWLKLNCLGDDRLPKAALKVQVRLDERNKTCWITGIKDILFGYGFGIVYMQGQVGDVKMFIMELKERLCKHYNSVWLNEVEQNKRLESYATFKSLLEPEKYLTCIENMQYRKILSKFRCSCHLFMIERGRHLGIKRQDRLCTMCGVVEDEEHVIMLCLKYNNIRELYLPEIVKYKCTFIEIMQCENFYTIKNLCKYLFAVMKCTI